MILDAFEKPVTGLIRLLAGLAGLGVGLAIYSRVGELVKGGRSDQGIFVLAIALPAALIGGTVYASLAELSWERRRGLLVHGLGVAFFWWGFLTPYQRDRDRLAAGRKAQEKSRRPAVGTPPTRPTPASEAGRAPKESKEARAAFLGELWKSGSHGPTGVVPPMLGVAENAKARITITNLGATPLHIALARVKESPGSNPRWRGCDMDPLMGGPTYAFVKPGEIWFFDLHPLCPEDLREATLEYRVGRSPGDTGWWSDSAFDAPAGRPAKPAATGRGAGAGGAAHEEVPPRKRPAPPGRGRF